MKLLEHAVKIVERMLERRIQTLISLDKMRFLYIPGNDTVDIIFITRRMQEEQQKKEKMFYIGFVDMEKITDRVLRNVMKWSMRKKGLSKVMVRAVIS